MFFFLLQISSPPSDPPTHTGQHWSPDDMRNARYMHWSKEVNTRWAVDLIKEVPPKEVDERVVSCDGGGGALGHPRCLQWFLKLHKTGFVLISSEIVFLTM